MHPSSRGQTASRSEASDLEWRSQLYTSYRWSGSGAGRCVQWVLEDDAVVLVDHSDRAESALAWGARREGMEWRIEEFEEDAGRMEDDDETGLREGGRRREWEREERTCFFIASN
uniref:Uncharacterized protein n=1 Tax=Pristionchus pacificus TaxID=54126 RepID=A0A2A6BZI1_PRIPA|eukprot:PDM71298.1 hypothetical protein PRIPAC_37705 [Pristionchus pacificus]